MENIKRFIEQLLSDKKLREGKNFTTRVYHDEPILQTAAQMANYLPPRCRKMRGIARSHAALGKSADWVFYQQGKFMEDFEDDFDYHGTFIRYFPTYQAMNDLQLRGYFSWRTKVRRGEVGRTSLSFAFVYIYELLNQIGVPDPAEGLCMLRRFWKSYRVFEPSIDRYMRAWLSDYVVYYGLDRSLLRELSDVAFDENLLVLLRTGTVEDREMFPALAALSSYRIEHSRFYKQHSAEVEAVACASFRAWAEYYEKNRQKSLIEKLFGRKITCPYQMFQSAVFYDQRRYEDYTYEINAIHRYACKKGVWTCEKYFGSRGRNRELGAFLRAVDCLMRQEYGFKQPLKEEKITKVLQWIIRREIARYLELKRRSEVPKVEIDLTKLQGIRQAAEITRDRLIVDEEPGEIPIAAAPPPPEEAHEPPEYDTGLTEAEIRYLRALLCGGDPGAALREAGALASVLVDSINEKLFDRFGDTVILYDGDAPEPIEDYAEELKGIVER